MVSSFRAADESLPKHPALEWEPDQGSKQIGRLNRSAWVVSSALANNLTSAVQPRRFALTSAVRVEC